MSNITLTDFQSDEPLALRDEVARAYDSEAFEEHDIERRSTIAAIQWAARRKLATEAADRLMPWLAAHDAEVARESVLGFVALSADALPAGPVGSGVQRDGAATDRPVVAAIEDTDSPSSPARQEPKRTDVYHD